MMMIRRVVLSILFYPHCRKVRRRPPSLRDDFFVYTGIPQMAPDLTGNILAFLAFLQDRSEVWAATVTWAFLPPCLSRPPSACLASVET